MYEPVPMSFSMVLSSEETDAVLEFVGVQWSQLETSVPNNTLNPWTVKGTPTANMYGTTAPGLKTTKGRGLTGDGLYGGGRIDSKGSAIGLRAFADKKKVAVDVEFIAQERDGARKFGYRLKEVHFPPGEQQIGESADFVTLSMNGQMYGEMQRITTFSRALNILTNTLFS